MLERAARAVSSWVWSALYLAPEFLPTFEQSKNRVKQLWRNERYDVEVRLYYSFLHEGLLRTILSKLGQRIGESGIYWAYGLCFYGSQYNTEVLINSVLPSIESVSTQDYIVLKLEGSRAQELPRLS